MPELVSFPSGDEKCAGAHWRGDGPEGRPCVVMAHGLGATRDCGLDGFAEAFAAAGCDVVAFDYRHFGASGGEPRQLVDPKRQLDDYAAAIAFARGLDGVDPDRIVVWGCSFAGGHAFEVAARDGRAAAMISMTPAPDGLASSRMTFASSGPRVVGQLTRLGIADAMGALRGRPPVYVPVVGEPGELAGLTAPGAVAAWREVAGPTWENRLAARVFLTIGSYRPGRAASRVSCPALVQVADLDTLAPPRAAEVAAEAAGARVHHYPCDHFDVYPGRPWFDAVLAHQLRFLTQTLALTPAVAA